MLIQRFLLRDKRWEVMDAMAPTVREGSVELGQQIRSRRLELGLTIEQAASKAGVGSESWRRYEGGQSIRQDKVDGLRRALKWKRWPQPIDGSDATDIVPTAATETQWDGVATRAYYSPATAAEHGETNARVFALGSELFTEELRQDIASLSATPRGTHLGEIKDSWLERVLPDRWLTRYDYEFCHQLLAVAVRLRERLASRTDDPPNVIRSPADSLVFHLIVRDGSEQLGSEENPADLTDPFAWGEQLDPHHSETVRALYSQSIHPSPDDRLHFEHWFDEVVTETPPPKTGAAVSKHRRIESFRTTLQTLRDRGQMEREALSAAVEESFRPTEAENRVSRERDGKTVWQMQFGYDLSSGKKAGLLTNEGTFGSWRVTPAGRKAVDLPDDALYNALRGRTQP